MADKTRVFVPEEFEKTEEFYEKVSRYLARKSADFLWIQNPQEPYTAWNCASLYRSGCIRIGKYRILLGSREVQAGREEAPGVQDEREVTFAGAFACGDVIFDCGKVTLDLTAKNGILSFTFEGTGETFARLDAGLRYFMPLEETDECPQERGFLADFYNPVFTSTSDDTKTVFSAHISPCEVLNDKVSYISISVVPKAVRLSEPLEPSKPSMYLESNFMTLTGERLTCAPLEDACLVFQRSASAQATVNQETVLSGFDFYLGVKGTFQCGQKEFIPGLFGGEYISAGGSLQFEPGRPALLSGAPEEFRAANAEVTTSWLKVQGAYYSSASGSSLYTMEREGFRPFVAKAADLTADCDAFSCFPWLNADFADAEEGKRAEALLYDKRFGVLTPEAAVRMRRGQRDEEQEKIAVTPCGMCAGIQPPNDAWNWIGLGNVAGGEKPDICLTGDLSRAKQLFLRKECFIAVSSEKEFAQLGGAVDFSISVAGWRVSLPKEKWEEQGALVILKYSRSFSIADELADQPAFRKLMDSAYKDGKEIAEYHAFLEAVTDRNFEGLVLLNAQAAGEDLPCAAREIVSGIPDLRAVYLAVNSSKISVENGRIQIGRSAVAGFVHYSADEKTASEEGYFKTVGLSAQIMASEMVSFCSKSELFLPEILGEAAGCCLVLIGTMGQESGMDDCRFYLEAEVLCDVAESAVEHIRIDTAQLLLTEERKRFVLGGALAFVKADGCDLFSYDGMRFENLCIVMDAHTQKLSEDLSELRFAAERSTVRQKSLAEAFGACIEQYYAGMTAAPDRCGYCSVNTPVAQAEIEGNWNGMSFRIGIGSDGNLGKGAEISVSLLLAWSGKSYYFGVKETDLNAFTISGVLGFGFGGMELVMERQTYMLKFCNVGIKLLNYTLPRESADLYVFGDKGKLGWYMGYGEVKECRK